MKNIIKYTGGLVAIMGAVSLQSCDKDFADTNTNPDAVTKPIPEYVFTKAEYDGTSNMANFLLGTMQYTTSFNEVAGFGSKYNAAQTQQTFTQFSNGYVNEINELGIVIKAVKDNATKSNLLAQARIWRVYCFSRLTDLYGDVPYFQSGLGYDSSLYKPGYDAQKDIYTDLLSELDAAAQSLDASKPTIGASDLIYGGSTAQWKKLAYSLMLRCAMRMTKVDAASAKTWATKAIAGGVITQDVDIARIIYNGSTSAQDINRNPLALNLWNSDYVKANGVDNTEGGKYQQVWINYLKSTNDPRLPVISVVWNGGVPDTTVSIQQGMPSNLGSKPGNFGSLSEPNPKTVLLLGSPRLIFTAAESYFLLTEAALRGWYSGATAASLYQNGIQAALRQWAIIAGTAAGTIPTAAINNYVAANPLNTGGSFDAQMNQIYTQFWVSIFPDAQEVFASYRRTGYPALVPNNYPANATGGQIFRRFLYPVTEATLNADSYNAAISRQGANDLLTRIWWDKQ